MLPPDWVPNGWAHVWLGATVENMTEARWRIPALLRVPARVHWLSVAPLLEPLDLRPWLGRGVDWIVVGGETGARDARYMEPDWARDLRDQCRDTLSQADVEAAGDPCRSDGARVSGALIGSWVATIGMLNLHRFGHSIRLHEPATDPPFTYAVSPALPAEPRLAPVSPPVA